MLQLFQREDGQGDRVVVDTAATARLGVGPTAIALYPSESSRREQGVAERMGQAVAKQSSHSRGKSEIG